MRTGPPSRVKASPIALECKYIQTVDLPRPKDGSCSSMVIGQVVGIHVADEIVMDGIIDLSKVSLLARLGYLDYAKIEESNIFTMRPPAGDTRYAKK